MKFRNSYIQIFAVLLTLFLLFFKTNISYNEMDVIPYGRALYNSNWLSNDWYLNLKIPYRFLFSYPVGYFSDIFGFLKTIYIGRLFSYLFFAISINKLINTIRSSQIFIYYLLALITFFSFFGHGSGAGEWMIGGLDTKVFAYGFVILSISYFIESEIKKWLIFSGLAISFHLLIGFYSLLSFLPLIIIYQTKSENYIKDTIKLLPYFIIPASIGIYGIIYQLIIASGNISNIGWDIYVNIRVPHHTIPSVLSRKYWIFLVIFSSINIYIFIKTKIINIKYISIYTLTTVGISLLGLVVFFIFGNSHILKYYFFRFADVMLPLLTLISITYFIIEELKTLPTKTKKLINFSIIIIVFSFFAFKIKLINSEYNSYSNQKSYDTEMIAWVKNNTTANDIFIVNPNSDMFYINYERPMFVSWKHSPQNNNDIIEWYNRLKLLNGGNDFSTLNEITTNYENITENQILAIQKTYGNLRYIIMPKSKFLNFPILHETPINILYEISN